MNLVGPTALFAAPLAVGGLSTVLSKPSDETVQQYYAKIRQGIPFMPPAQVFGPVWTLLYTLMGISIVLLVMAFRAQQQQLAMISAGTGAASSMGLSLRSNPLFVAAVGLFAIQLMLNFMWSIFFFRLKNASMALGILIALDVVVAITTVLFFKLKPLSGALLIPYLAWILFATYLNVSIVRKMKATTAETKQK